MGYLIPREMAAMKAAMKAAKPMKAMKAAKPMKAAAMKKTMKVSKIATGKYSKSRVFKGTKEKTTGGLTKSDLVKSKSGKIVSKKASLKGKKMFKGSALEKWGTALSAARKALGLKGFVACKQGSPLYIK